LAPVGIKPGTLRGANFKIPSQALSQPQMDSHIGIINYVKKKVCTRMIKGRR